MIVSVKRSVSGTVPMQDMQHLEYVQSNMLMQSCRCCRKHRPKTFGIRSIKHVNAELPLLS